MPIDSCSGKRAVESRLPERLIDWLSNTKSSDLKLCINKQQKWTLQLIYIYICTYITIRKGKKAYQFESKGMGGVGGRKKGGDIIIFLLKM